METKERTLVLVKPDGVHRGLIGEVISRCERRGLTLLGIRMLVITPEMAQHHYAEHDGKPFFKGLVEFISAAPVVAMVWQGPSAVSVVRTMMGTTNPALAPPGSIRGDFALTLSMNVIHGSDGVERAKEEIATFFSPDDLVDWTPAALGWVHE